MDVASYLRRINYNGGLDVSNDTLFAIHESHTFNVPFENLDIHYKKIFYINPTDVFKKIVLDKRGGFCYELNLLFSQLLSELGFASRILTARVYDDSGKPGPEHDHMCVLVQTDKTFLADVGFGDFFIRPLEIATGIQFDGRNYFRIESTASDNYDVLMSPDSTTFQKKYTFSLRKVTYSDFVDSCLKKQTDPESRFVKNTICTLATESGRISIFNDKMIEKNNGIRTEAMIQDDDDLREKLKTKFQIEIN